MDWLELLGQIFNVCIVPLLGLLTTFLVTFLKSKIAQVQATTKNELLNKYLSILETTVVNCVSTTNQTYVDALKDKNAFDAAAQKEAFSITFNAVMASLTDDVKAGMSEVTTDLPTFVTQLIENTVANKKH
jgi:hypothetical protein